MSLVLLTPPVEEPISLTEAKQHLRVDDSNEDLLIGSLIAAARGYAETTTGRALLPQQWRLTMDSFPFAIYPNYPRNEYNRFIPDPLAWWYSSSIQLLRVPLITVDSIKYYDTAGVQQTFSSANYIVDTTSLTGEVSLAFGQFWPFTQWRKAAVTVDFTAGYADIASIPSDLKAAMRLILGDLYVNREASVDGVRANVNPVVRNLLDRYVVSNVG